ncbi:hypothetical protein DEJ50_18910 [Streptomyces venezuelae]|uniref:Uncharacterized protein n=1 Tax=Streptomyces venezuelae TaxID=54571 RepID=A0A5P2D349_STRVZ|nr:hypothetical protein [Streptomyces venezuelae]QES49565.1 hypothetical protein DEJ50_18910 [Streptomyces venezuelae]
MAGVPGAVGTGHIPEPPPVPKRKQEQNQKRKPKRKSVTAALLVLTPLLIACSGWLVQPLGLGWLALGTLLSMVVLCTAWALCGAWPGTCVAVSGFALMLFLGPSLDEAVIEHRGVRYEALVVDTETHKRTSRPRQYWCRVGIAPDAGAKVRFHDVSCGKDHRVDDWVTVVVDPEDWLATRLAERSHGPSTGVLWTCAGLFLALEGSILWGRLRRRTG